MDPTPKRNLANDWCWIPPRRNLQHNTTQYKFISGGILRVIPLTTTTTTTTTLRILWPDGFAAGKKWMNCCWFSCLFCGSAASASIGTAGAEKNKIFKKADSVIFWKSFRRKNTIRLQDRGKKSKNLDEIKYHACKFVHVGCLFVDGRGCGKK